MLHHRPTILFAALSSAALFAFACGDQGSSDPGSSSAAKSIAFDGGAGSDGASAAASDAGSDGGDAATASAQCLTSSFAVCSDAQIMAIFQALNNAEVSLANLVVQQGVSGQVAIFANQMIVDHTAALRSVATLNTNEAPVEGGLTVEINTEAQLEFVRFSQMSAGSQLDQTFIAQSILAHTETLALIRWVLIPSAQNPELQSMLKSAEAEVQQHLTNAMALQTMLVGQCGGTPQTAVMDGGCPATGSATQNDAGMGVETGTSSGTGTTTK